MVFHVLPVSESEVFVWLLQLVFNNVRSLGVVFVIASRRNEGDFAREILCTFLRLWLKRCQVGEVERVVQQSVDLPEDVRVVRARLERLLVSARNAKLCIGTFVKVSLEVRGSLIKIVGIIMCSFL